MSAVGVPGRPGWDGARLIETRGETGGRLGMAASSSFSERSPGLETAKAIVSVLFFLPANPGRAWRCWPPRRWASPPFSSAARTIWILLSCPRMAARDWRRVKFPVRLGPIRPGRGRIAAGTPAAPWGGSPAPGRRTHGSWPRRRCPSSSGSGRSGRGWSLR